MIDQYYCKNRKIDDNKWLSHGTNTTSEGKDKKKVEFGNDNRIL